MNPGDRTAFPVPCPSNSTGMDLRTYIATQIGAALVAKGLEHCALAAEINGTATTKDLFAEAAVRLADALIARLEMASE